MVVVQRDHSLPTDQANSGPYAHQALLQEIESK